MYVSLCKFYNIVLLIKQIFKRNFLVLSFIPVLAMSTLNFTNDISNTVENIVKSVLPSVDFAAK